MKPRNYRTDRINLIIPTELLKPIGMQAVRDFTTRRNIIRMALLEYTRKQASTIKLEAKPGHDIRLEKLLAATNSGKL